MNSSPKQALAIAVMTISDSRSKDNDQSGDLLAQRIEQDQHNLVERAWVKDEIEHITAKARQWINRANIQIIIATGGTGLTKRDVSFEAFSSLYEKTIISFPIAFHQVSDKQIGLASILSRVSAGVANGTLIFSLPGSPNACRDGWDGILSALLNHHYRPCNLAELLPRL